MAVNFLNQSNSQINLNNSLWMFNSDFTTFYSDRYDFLKFRNNNGIEYLNSRGQLLRKESYEINKEGFYKIKGNPNFRGIELINSNEINFVNSGEHFENDINVGIKDIKFNFSKINPTDIELNSNQLEKIINKSKWRVKLADKQTEKLIELSKWNSISQAEKEIILNDKKKFVEHKKTNHLIRIDDSIILVQQRLDRALFKLKILRIKEDEIIIENPLKGNENLQLKRII